MEDNIIDIIVENEGRSYKGWFIASEKKNATEFPTSFHVVLDNVFFANLSLSNGKWVADDQRPSSLIAAVGKSIEHQLPAINH